MYIGETVVGDLIEWDEWGRGPSIWVVCSIGKEGFWAMGRERRWFSMWEVYAIRKLA